MSSTPASAILLGKALAFILVGGGLAASLVILVHCALVVTIGGTIGSLAQAVQFAMLTLLASMFFGGIFLNLDALRFPFKAVSFVLPVTFAIRGLHDVILRGSRPAVLSVLPVTFAVRGLHDVILRGSRPAALDLAGLGALTIVPDGIARMLLRRETRRG